MKRPAMVSPALEALAAADPADPATLRAAFDAADAELRAACRVIWELRDAGPDERNDLVQQALLKLWMELDGQTRPRDGRGVLALFLTIARNAAIDRHRREARLLQTDELDDVPAPEESPPLAATDGEVWAVCRDAAFRYPWLRPLVFAGELLDALERGGSQKAFAAEKGLPEARVNKYWNRFQWGVAGILLVDDELREQLHQPDLLEAARVFAEWLDGFEHAELVRRVLRGESRTAIAGRPGSDLDRRLHAAKLALIQRAATRGGEKANVLATIVTRAWARIGL